MFEYLYDYEGGLFPFQSGAAGFLRPWPNTQTTHVRDIP